METIEKYAKKGENHDIIDALTLLTKAYISMCGISLGYRTIIYCAAEAWKEKLAWLDLPLSEMARKGPLVCMMPHITNEYDSEKYDRYDITGMDKEELLSGCKQIVCEKAFDEVTLEVLCWGLLKSAECFDAPYLSEDVETTAPDGTLLKGILEEQRCGSTWMMMIAPYNSSSIVKTELVRDAKELLIEGYEECQRMRNMEQEVRALYPKYQAELKKRKNESAVLKHEAFDDVYKKMIGDTIVCGADRLFHEWWGLKFYNMFVEKQKSKKKR